MHKLETVGLINLNENNNLQVCCQKSQKTINIKRFLINIRLAVFN